MEEVILKDRISTGTRELDSLLLGGIPKEYAVVLTSPPCDERQMLVNNFLKAGIESDEVIFYVTTEAVELDEFLKKPDFYLFLCNPKPKTTIPVLPNIHRIEDKTDLTNLGISFAKAYRKMDKTKQDFPYSEYQWNYGDKLYKLAERFYGDPKLWWIIAHVNMKPTDSHYEVGDTIIIPSSNSLNKVIQMLGY